MCLFLDQNPSSSRTLAFLANTDVQTLAVWIISLPLTRIQGIFWFVYNTNWLWLCTWKHTLYFDCMGISYEEWLFYISMKFTVHLRKSLRVFFFLKAAASLHIGSWGWILFLRLKPVFHYSVIFMSQEYLEPPLAVPVRFFPNSLNHNNLKSHYLHTLSRWFLRDGCLNHTVFSMLSLGLCNCFFWKPGAALVPGNSAKFREVVFLWVFF